MTKVRIGGTDTNADWIKWRTDDVLGAPRGDEDEKPTFLGTVRGRRPPVRESPFVDVVRGK